MANDQLFVAIDLKQINNSGCVPNPIFFPPFWWNENDLLFFYYFVCVFVEHSLTEQYTLSIFMWREGSGGFAAASAQS